MMEDKVDEKVTNGILEFSIDLMKILYQEAKENNVIFSPLSISAAISLVYLGAAGNTHKEIGNILRNATEETATTKKLTVKEFHENISKLLESLISKKNEKYETTIVSVANGIFIQEGIEVKPSYMDQAKTLYKTEVANLDFKNNGAAAIQKINKWVLEKTVGRIPQLYQTPLDSDTLIILANTLYFKGEWHEKFRSTKVEKFSTGTDEIMVPMMHNVEYASYVNNESLQFEAIGLAYNGHAGFHGAGPYKMIIILPYLNQTLTNVTDNLKPEHIKEILRAHDPKVDYKIPRFKFSSSLSMKDTLLKLGMQEAFSRAADFKEMLNQPAFVADVQHAAEIEVDEHGTKASAVTVSRMMLMCGRFSVGQPIPFHANRPFLALVCHRSTSTILFAALVQKPEISISPESSDLSNSAA